MYLIGVFVILCSFLGQHVCAQPDKNFNKLYDAEWRCDSVCFGSGGKAEFDPKNKICKCSLGKNIDDTEQEVILKNANVLGVHLILETDTKKELTKREVDVISQQGENDIVGQRTPQRIITPRPRTPLRPFSTSRRPTIRTSTRRPIIRITTPRRRLSSRRPINVHQRWQQIQNQINERRRSMARTNGGPHLQMRAGFQEETTPKLVDRLKERQRERLEKLKSKNLPGATSASSSSVPSTKGKKSSVTVANRLEEENGKQAKVETAAAEKKSHEVITQDPSLY